MTRIVAVTLAVLMGAGTIAFAQDLSHASEGRLSIHSVGATVTQVETINGQAFREVYQVTPDHTLSLVTRAPVTPD